METIIALPENIFYNTGIATYIWLLSNRKNEERRGKVQLIDGTEWYMPLRRNLGKKNCELSEEQIQTIVDLVVNPRETEKSKIFPNQAFGYWKVTVDRPLRVEGADSQRVYKAAEIKAFKSEGRVTEEGVPIIKKIHKKGTQPDPLHGLFKVEIGGKPCVVEYEPDSNLRDSEQIPLLEDGGIEAFFRREVLPYTPDAWIEASKTQIGYEVSFTRHFYKPVHLRTLDEIKADIYALEQDAEGLLEQSVGEA